MLKKIIEYFQNCLKVSFYAWSFSLPLTSRARIGEKSEKKDDCYAGYYSWAKIIGGIYEKKKKN